MKFVEPVEPVWNYPYEESRRVSCGRSSGGSVTGPEKRRVTPTESLDVCQRAWSKKFEVASLAAELEVKPAVWGKALIALTPGGADQFRAVAVGQRPGNEGPGLTAPRYPPADLEHPPARPAPDRKHTRTSHELTEPPERDQRNSETPADQREPPAC